MPVASDAVEILQVKKLLHCVRECDYYQIKKLCEKGVEFLINFNEPNEGQTALILAAIMNNEQMLNFLLQNGAHPNIVDFKGRSPLMKAAELGHTQAMEILKKAKADPNIRDAEGKDVLFYCLAAPTNRHNECMKIVLAMAPNVNNKTNSGTPILVEACKQAVEHKDMCLMLLEAGCDPTVEETKTQRTALHYAAGCGSVEVCRAILKKNGNPNALDRHKLMPAHDAARGGHFEVLPLLSAYGAHFDAYDIKGNNPIHFAAYSNAGSCCRFLATRGCNPKAKNNEGQTPKALAKEQKAKDASKNLRKAEKQYAKLSKQTMSSESGDVNWSIRLYDYMYEHKERVKDAFLAQDPEATGKITKDAFLEVIAKEGFQKLVETEEMKKLVMAHEKVKDEIDYELFLLGKKYINKQFLMNSFEKKKKKKKKKKGKAKKGKTKIVLPICVLDDGPRMGFGDPPAIYQPQHVLFTDTTRFHRDHPPSHPLQDDSVWYLKQPDKAFVNIAHAAHHGDLHTLLDAFKRGLPVDIRDKYYKTPLMVAASNGDVHTVRFLLACGADLNAFDNFKWTPLHHAAHSGQLEVVKMLVENGANINSLTITEATPFMRAIESASYPVVEYLMAQGAKVMQENMQGKTAYDLAKDYADPRIYMAVKAKFESLPQPKDAGKKKSAKKKKKKKKPDKKKKKKKEGSDEEQEVKKRDSFLPPIGPLKRESSFSKAEALLEQGLSEKTDRVMYKPLHVWTEQDTTEQILTKKQELRDRFGWEHDFEDYKIPLMKNVKSRLEKLGVDNA